MSCHALRCTILIYYYLFLPAVYCIIIATAGPTFVPTTGTPTTPPTFPPTFAPTLPPTFAPVAPVAPTLPPTLFPTFPPTTPPTFAPVAPIAPSVFTQPPIPTPTYNGPPTSTNVNFADLVLGPIPASQGRDDGDVPAPTPAALDCKLFKLVTMHFTLY